MRQHKYVYLDGIRGIAALMIMLRHTGALWHFALERSYLAVDLFFILSGFVIAHAYDEKLLSGELDVAKFASIRLIRLYPMYFLSLIFAALALLLQSGGRLEVWFSIALAAFYLPSRVEGSTELFPVNGVYWSLFFELLVNLIYAAVSSVLSHRVLVAIVVSFAVVLAAFSFAYNSLDLGHEWDFYGVCAGLSRAIFGIFAGLGLYRVRQLFLEKFEGLCSPWVAGCVVCAVLACPNLGALNGAIDLIAVIAIFPIMVLFASSARPTRFARELAWMGSVSYPVYVLHRPLGFLLLAFTHGAVGRYAPLSGVVFTLALLAFATWLERSFDVPVRRLLSAKRR